MSEIKTLFENIEPYSTGYLKVDGHEIYYEECGNPNGKPAVFLHGGPGGGGSTKVRGFFDPKLFRLLNQYTKLRREKKRILQSSQDNSWLISIDKQLFDIGKSIIELSLIHI